MRTVTIPAGTTKVLLMDNDAIHRNASRRAGFCEPVAVVVELDESGAPKQTLKGHKVEIKGTTELGYSQHEFLLTVHRTPYRAAHITKGEVVLTTLSLRGDNGDGEAGTAEVVPPVAPKAPKKPARVNNIQTEATA